ncbi:MAG: PUA domain-containing protein, partial [Rhodanobacter sp.]
LYTSDPRHNADAMPIDEVSFLTPEILAMAGDVGSLHGTGGMRTKLEAAEKAATAGIETILFNGCDREVVNLLSRDLLRGTRLRTDPSRLNERKYWLRHTPAAAGFIQVAICDEGASLLPRGIVTADGTFQRGDVVEIVTGEGAEAHGVARGITHYGVSDINRIAGCHSSDIVARLGYSHGEPVMHRDDLVTFDMGATHD